MNTPIDTKETARKNMNFFMFPVIYDIKGINKVAYELLSVINSHKGITYAQAEMALEIAKQLLDSETISSTDAVSNYFEGKLPAGDCQKITID